MADNYWGAMPDPKTIATPASILKEQAKILQEATSGKLRGAVSQATQGEEFTYVLSIVAPALNNYRYDVCEIRHKPVFYPLTYNPVHDQGLYRCKDEMEFRERLKATLAGERTRQVVA